MHNTIIEAFDDGYFPSWYKGGKGCTYIAGVETVEFLVVRRIAWSTVNVDSNTSMSKIIELSKFFEGEVVILDGVTYAGFDVVDPDQVSDRTGKGVIVIQLYPLNLDKIKVALQKHFVDWRERYSVIEKTYLKMIYYDTPWRTIKIYVRNIDLEKAFYILKNACLFSPVPEPLRIADKLASALSQVFSDKPKVLSNSTMKS
ncbi:MAG: DUF99 family protein [Desulfurococcaceae archaeon]